MTKRACLFLMLAVAACDKPRPSLPAARRVVDAAPTTQVVELPTQTVMLKGKPFVLEIADDDRETETGLMYRQSMPADHGMLFVFAQVQPRNFWMKNTLIPLDIAYLDSTATVVNVEQMYPLDETGVRSAGPMKYAIELNQGTAARIGLQRGDHIDLPAATR